MFRELHVVSSLRLASSPPFPGLFSTVFQHLRCLGLQSAVPVDDSDVGEHNSNDYMVYMIL